MIRLEIQIGFTTKWTEIIRVVSYRSFYAYIRYVRREMWILPLNDLTYWIEGFWPHYLFYMYMYQLKVETMIYFSWQWFFSCVRISSTFILDKSLQIYKESYRLDDSSLLECLISMCFIDQFLRARVYGMFIFLCLLVSKKMLMNLIRVM